MVFTQCANPEDLHTILVRKLKKLQLILLVVVVINILSI